ncbi:MAG: hypothetical protein D6744_12065 [Planctomycetota bacterium]|nr:MAG: hypothetical protein D6744_12065 [Planctomycetota bacterium]
MHKTGWIVAALAFCVAGWLVFDGVHALITGDYVTPSDGPHAGQLGPWSHLVSAIGVEPRSTAMKVFHVAFGGAWLAAMTCFVAGVHGSWRAMLAFAVLAAWYLPIGAILGVVQVILLLRAPLRKQAARIPPPQA